MAGKKKTIPTFEEGLEGLEKLVIEMETGEMPLEESIKAYEQGMLLYGELQKQLEAAKARIEKIQVPVRKQPDGAVETEPFEVEDE